MSDAPGTSFRSETVVALYRHRPPYAAAIYDEILANSPARTRLLDLGSGEGKIARPMTQYFEEVIAVDPSNEMIRLGESLPQGRAKNLHWIDATAEAAPLTGHFDAVTFASSVHWMEPTTLFSKLRRHLNDDHIVAFINGDEPHDPPWQDDWLDFLSKWVPEMTGESFNSDAWQTFQTKHLAHVDAQETLSVLSDPFRQTIVDHILCQQSRDTFTRTKLGDRRYTFEAELENLLRPHADDHGNLTYRVKTNVTFAKLKPT